MSHLLWPRISKFSGLFHKTSFAGASQTNTQIHANDRPINREGIRDSALRGCVNTSGKAGAQIPQLPLGDDSPPWGR
jgi:hypothetical protein